MTYSQAISQCRILKESFNELLAIFYADPSFSRSTLRIGKLYLPIWWRLTRGCLSHVASNLVPWLVLHLLRRPNKLADESFPALPDKEAPAPLDPAAIAPGVDESGMRVNARMAEASSFMKWDRSCV
jgi:hypothetical protein